MSSGQAPLLTATPGAHDGQAARRRSPGTVRVTPSTLTETSTADGSNAPSSRPQRRLSFLWSNARSRCLRPRHALSRDTAWRTARLIRRRLPLGAPLTGARDGGREVRQDPRSLRPRRRFGSPAKRALPCDGTREAWGMREVRRGDGGWRGAMPVIFRDWRGELRMSCPSPLAGEGGPEGLG